MTKKLHHTEEWTGLLVDTFMPTSPLQPIQRRRKKKARQQGNARQKKYARKIHHARS